MAMNDWTVVDYRDPENPTPNGIWVYKTNPSFPNVHFSFSVDDTRNNHVGTDASPKSYYYGMNQNRVVPHFAGAPANPATQQMLREAWNDYYTITRPGDIG